jgi:cytochrome c biogenesis protein CcmG, thiol:disulfide interchange protein DsbE
VSRTQSRRGLLVLSMRMSAVLLVLILVAVLSYRIVHGLPSARSGARLADAIKAHQTPPAPNVRLSVIWHEAKTWPQPLRASIDGGTLRLRDLRGYPVVLNFWASWCGPCKREAAVLASAAQARSGQLVFVGLDMNDRTRDAQHFLRTHGVPYVAVSSGSSVASQFGLIGLPETFYVDRDGRIQGVTRGELSAATLRRALGRAFQN